MLSKSNPIQIIQIVRCLFVILIITNSYGQNTTYNQFWNEIQFNQTISEKWSTEIDVATSYSSTESSPNIFEQNTQKSLRGWGHYYLNPRWKLSSFLAYYNNKDFFAQLKEKGAVMTDEEIEELQDRGYSLEP